MSSIEAGRIPQQSELVHIIRVAFIKSQVTRAKRNLLRVVYGDIHRRGISDLLTVKNQYAVNSI